MHGAVPQYARLHSRDHLLALALTGNIGGTAAGLADALEEAGQLHAHESVDFQSLLSTIDMSTMDRVRKQGKKRTEHGDKLERSGMLVALFWAAAGPTRRQRQTRKRARSLVPSETPDW